MEFLRKFGDTVTVNDAASSLPDVSSTTDGVDLTPLRLRLQASQDGPNQPALPSRLVLYGFCGVGQTVTITGPVEVKVLRDGRWFLAGELLSGSDVVLTEFRGYLGLVIVGADCERMAIVSPGVAGGQVSFEVDAETTVEVLG